MNRAKAFSRTLAVATVLSAAAPSAAQLSEFTWDAAKTGSQTWQQAGNWTPSGFPNGPLQAANLSVPLGADLNVNVGAGVTIAGVALGGAAGARTTEISASAGGLLTFRNEIVPIPLTGNADFDGNTFVEGADFLIWQRNVGLTGQVETNNNGDADASSVVDAADLQVWKDQFGRGTETFAPTSAFINSVGAPGSTHTISAAVHLNDEQLEIAGTTNLSITGPLSYAGDPNNAGASNAAIRAISPGLVVTLGGDLALSNNDGADLIDFRINDSERNQGTLIFNGVLSGQGQLFIGAPSNGVRLPLGTVVLNGNNTFTGGVRAGRGNLLLGSNTALGTSSSYRQEGPANQFGYNILSTDDSRVINKPMVVAQWQTFKGEHSLEWAGNISQTNNRGVINLLPAGKELKLSGRINIFEEAEPGLVRRFEIHGTGTTRITGSVRDLPDDAVNSPEDHRLVKKGLGVLIVDVAMGDNNHIGDDVIFMGNWHYVDNDSLNVGGGQIRAYGGAIGVDTGVSGNAEFLGRINPASTGGIQLAPSDTSASLNFQTTMANAANMTVAAPETGLTFAGSIIPANGRYQLGGGTGTLTLPNAQLTGANLLEVRNGGVVELLGDNTYTGSTTILTKFTSTNDAVAEADSNRPNLSVGTNYFRQVAPTLVVDKLANGGLPSSIGAASSDAANLLIHGSTLKYVGAGDATDRLFTIGTGGATIDSSGTGALVFSNGGALGRDDAEDRLGSLDDFTGTRDSLSIYDMTDTGNIMPGMSATDPDADLVLGPPPFGPPLIPAGTVVTGISDDGTTLGISQSYGFHLKANTRIVFGTVPRTLTLAGSNAAANTIASLIGNSEKGGVVGITKTGAGTWVLTGANDYSGPTVVQQGVLLINGAQTGAGGTTVAAGATLGGAGTLGGALTANGVVAPGAGGAGTLTVAGNATFNSGSTALFEIGGTGAGQFDKLIVGGALTAGGTLDVDLVSGFTPAAGNSFDILDFTSVSGLFALNLPALPGGLAWNAANLLTTGALSVVAGLAAVPEPCAAIVALPAILAVQCARRRRATGLK